ncbi:acyltransferase [Ramlibacter sp. USB13]|uniref:Acyltransferase n=1 Tax=Ramlibacter cellulosilyticus TaxID=2764187 RepID=A0A923SD14_9BURK|nr:acyltransferase family protein [Ramlibacter cellulosilyticus]MBC5784858.1 acyltransferase [Ramlibacter cellulosilyticus]
MVGKRFDIQFLRGVAVLSVVLFHAFKETFVAGYLGVDVFFVISGFLITGMILRDLERSTFSFHNFYRRRARRLLPATISTLSVTTVLAVFLLTPAEFGDYAKQLIGALTFTANFFLAQQTGYFAGEAETKVLLHIWSLSLEEQFYFIAPAILWFTPMRGRPWLLVGAAGLSAALCYLLMRGEVPHLSTKAAAKAAFFMLPARAWELLIGGFAAWVMLRRPQLQVPYPIKLVALALTAVVLVRWRGAQHPGIGAALICLTTSVMLLGSSVWLRENLITKAVARLGDWSYSVYLVHWPLFAFAFIVYLGEPPVWLCAALVLVSLVLGYLQYKFVEQPLLNGWLQPEKRMWVGLGLGAGGLAVCAAAIAHVSTPMPGMGPQIGLSQACDQQGGKYKQLAVCRTGNDPEMVLWGDSFAMHLVPGFTKVMGPQWPFVQATKSACSPLVGLAHTSGGYNESWARDCIAFNRGVVESLRDMPSVRFVVLASSWVQVLNSGGQQLFDVDHQRPWSAEVTRSHLLSTIRELQALGKQVVLVGPTAMAKYDVGACNARALTGRVLAGLDNCDPLRDEIQGRLGNVLDELRTASLSTGAVLLLPTSAMCTELKCHSVVEGKSVYRDRGHLTPHGSEYVVRSMGFAQVLGRSSISIP